MAIMGMHGLLYTSEPEAVRGIFRDVFGPTFESGTRHQLTLMCDDITATVDELRAKGLNVRGEPQDEGFGVTTTIVLPGDLEVMLYEPRHQVAVGARGLE